MSPAEYFDAVKERLLTEPVIGDFHIRRERTAVTDGHLRARVTIADGSRLEFSEYVQRTQEGKMEVLVYSYHWENAAGELIYRWDNTPHHPSLSGFPHHVHVGQSGSTKPGMLMDIFAVLDHIAQELA